MTLVPISSTIVPTMGSIIRDESKSLAAALFGATRQAVLRNLFSHPDERFYLRRIIQLVGLGSGTVQRELEQLTGAGILNRVVEGRQTYYGVNHNCPVYNELRGLIRKTLGVAQVLKEALSSMASKIHIAFVYGSTAEGSESASSDIDVMVVGDNLSFREVVASLQDAQQELHREVNPTVYSVDEFSRKIAAGQHFVSTVVEGPKIFLIGDDGELGRLAKERVGPGPQSKPAGNRRPVRRRRS